MYEDLDVDVIDLMLAGIDVYAPLSIFMELISFMLHQFELVYFV
jgi:hypothetical protein